jgi:hypothetical protein
MLYFERVFCSELVQISLGFLAGAAMFAGFVSDDPRGMLVFLGLPCIYACGVLWWEARGPAFVQFLRVARGAWQEGRPARTAWDFAKQQQKEKSCV